MEFCSIAEQISLKGWSSIASYAATDDKPRAMSSLNIAEARRRKAKSKLTKKDAEERVKDHSLFYHWQRGQPPGLCLCTKRWMWRAVWRETFTHGSVRGWGWNSLALLDPVLYAASRGISYCPPENAENYVVSAQIPALPHADTCAGRCRYLRFWGLFHTFFRL